MRYKMSVVGRRGSSRREEKELKKPELFKVEGGRKELKTST